LNGYSLSLVGRPAALCGMQVIEFAIVLLGWGGGK